MHASPLVAMGGIYSRRSDSYAKFTHKKLEYARWTGCDKLDRLAENGTQTIPEGARKALRDPAGDNREALYLGGSAYPARAGRRRPVD